MGEFDGTGEMLIGVARSWLFWALFIIFVILAGFGTLYLRKRKRYKYPTIVVTDLGGGKSGFEVMRCGWFKSEKVFFKLFDTGGERRLETKDGRIVQQGSTEDFHEVDYRRGLVCVSKPDDPKVLIPIKYFRLTKESREAMMEIAPADYRDTSGKILDEAKKETTDKWTQMAAMVTFGILGVVLLVTIIMVIQFARNSLTEANALLDDAMNFKKATIERINVADSNIAGSSAP